MAWITQVQINDQLDRLGTHNIKQALSECSHHDWSYPSLLLAIASRESDVENIVGDNGHGRGGWQIDDRTWIRWLDSVDGVRSGTWTPVVKGATAGDAGYCPTLNDGVTQAITILHQNWTGANGTGTKRGAVMVAAYNCGLGGALSGLHEFENPDHFTTDGNYSVDVFQRETLVRTYLRAKKLIPV